MRPKSRARLLALLFMIAASAAAQSPDASQLARFKEKIKRDLTSIGNYTCLETIVRTRRAPPSNDFRPVDTVRLEVSTVAGKELFAKPGRRFDDRDVQSLVTSGTIGSGMFSMFVQNLFVNGKGTARYAREEKLAGRSAVRYDFHMTQQESGFQLQFFNVSEMVAAKGSFWFDPVSLDLIRLEIHGKDIPFALHLAEAVVVIDYARTRIGDSEALLPKRSELKLTYLSNDTNRNVTEFSQCRAYRTESTIAFTDDRSSPAQATQPAPPARSESMAEEAAAPAAAPAGPGTSAEPPAPAAAATTTEPRGDKLETAVRADPAAAAQPTPAPVPVAAKPEPPANNPEAVVRNEPLLFKSEVSVVMVPVVVRDRKGSAVGNLHKEDFRLFDGSRRQEISYFNVQRAERAVPQSGAGSSGPTAEKPPAVPPERFVAYVFDDVDIKFEDLVSVRDAAWRNISDSLQATDRVAIMTTSGRTLLDFTDDRAKTHDALLRLRPNSLYRPATRECPDLGFYQAYAIVKGMGGGVNLTTPGGADFPPSSAGQFVAVAIQDLENCNPMFDPRNKAPDPVTENQEVELAARRVVAWREREIDVVLKSLEILSGRMALLPGQRSIILVSPGLFVTDALLPREMEAIDRALRAGVVISALDALGLATANPAGEIDGNIQADAPHPRVVEEKVPFRKAENEAGAQALAALAEGTGGKFVGNTNDFAGAYRQLSDLPECVYVLGFTPKDVKPGSFHRVNVKLAGGEKYDLQARRGYFAPVIGDEKSEAGRGTREAVFSRVEVSTLPLKLQTDLDKSDPADLKLMVIVGVDVKQLRRKDPGDLTVVVALFDGNGNFLGGNQKTLDLSPRGGMARTAGEEPPLLLKTAFSVKPGGYRVRLVVHDKQEQTLEAQNQAVTLP